MARSGHTERRESENKVEMQAAGSLMALARRFRAPHRCLPHFTTTTTTTQQQQQQGLRRMSTALRPREQKLLEEDPALKRFKSEKGKVELIKRFGDVLVIAVVAGSTYEIYYRVQAKQAAQAEESTVE